jgi:tetratricopeptide (TPR) repeat protein
MLGMTRILAVAVAAVSLAGAQAPPADIMPTMQKFTKALGVSCNYCHSAERGSGQPEPKKDIARSMMAMTRDVNAKIALATGRVEPDANRVDCVTCHRGVAIPQQLTDVITRTLNEKGVAAAAAQYRELHKNYYGRASYDFSDDTLLGIAQRLNQVRPDDAIALLQVNLEFNPQSAATYAAIAFAYTRKLDDASAMANLEKALEIEPDNGVIRGQLEQLKSYHRKKP